MPIVLLKRLTRNTVPAVALLALLVFPGCAHKKPAIQDVAARPQGQALAAEATIEMGRVMPASGRARIYAQAPGSFRIEVKGPFAQVVALFASDGYTLHTFADGVEKYYPAGSPEAPLPFSSAQIVSLLMGADLSPLKDAGFAVETDPQGRPVMAVKETAGADTGAVTVLFSDYRDAGGRQVPFEISIQGPRLDRIRIIYSSVEIDPVFDDGFFAIEAGGQE